MSFSDAIAGSKQIQMLGLSGNYTQLTLEFARAAGAGITLGTQLCAGYLEWNRSSFQRVGSVANDSRVSQGQINVELKKPENAERCMPMPMSTAWSRPISTSTLSRPLVEKMVFGLIAAV